MKPITKRILKIFLWVFVAIIAIVAVVIIFISPISKYVIEKYDHQILGRKIRLSWIYVNPFTGYAHIHNLKIYEKNDSTLFFTAKGLSVNFAMLKLLSKTYEIEEITVSKPWARIVQNRKAFNFDDIIAHFAPKDTTTKKAPGPPLHFNILDSKIEAGEFHYEETSIPVSYYIKDVNISTPGKRWDADSMYFKYGFKSGPAKGEIKGDFHIDFDSMEYRLAIKIIKYDLKFIEQYINDLSNYGSFTANLDADVKASGNLGNKLAVTAMGTMAVNDFHFGRVPGDDYLSFDKIALGMINVSPRTYVYQLDSIIITHPFFKYERYDYLDNLQRMFGKGGSTAKATYADSTKVNLVIEIAKYMRDLAKNFTHSYYQIEKIRLYRGDVRFADYSLREKFAVSANPLSVYADSVDMNKKRAGITIKTGIKPYGDFELDLSLNPSDYGYFDLGYHLQHVPASLFNPYLVTYTSFPLDRGTIEINGDMSVKDSNIISTNHLEVIDPRVAKRINKKDTKWIPVPFIMSIVRETGNAIDYEIPVRGRLTNPKVKFGNVILSVLTNLFVKPVSTPFLIHEHTVEQKVEKYLTLDWKRRDYNLTEEEEKFVKHLNEFLVKDKSVSINVTPYIYADKEKEDILFFEAKKKYYAESRKIKEENISREDSIAIDKMSIKDHAFVDYLNRWIGDTSLFTVQEKCKRFISESIVDHSYNELAKNREARFKSLFKDDVQSQIKMEASETGIPFNGFSYYKITYKGDFPESLLKAYSDINEMDNKRPRSKFKKEREQAPMSIEKNVKTGK
jgi:hypothetical protein